MNILIAARAIAGMGGGGSVPKFHVIRYWLSCPPPTPTES